MAARIRNRASLIGMGSVLLNGGEKSAQASICPPAGTLVPEGARRASWKPLHGPPRENSAAPLTPEDQASIEAYAGAVTFSTAENVQDREGVVVGWGFRG